MLVKPVCMAGVNVDNVVNFIHSCQDMIKHVFHQYNGNGKISQ